MQNNITKKDLLDLGKSINKRFDTIDKRFERVDKQFQGVNKQFEGVNTRFNKVEQSIIQKIEASEKRMSVEIILAIKDAVHILEQKMIKFKDLILTTIDPLLKELEDRREDREIGTEQIRRLREEIDNHDKRIKKVEKHVQSAS